MKDTIGRNNRKLEDRACQNCVKMFRPLRSSSRFCSRQCMWAKNGGRNKKPITWWKNSKGYIEGRLWLEDGTQIRVKQHRFIVSGIIGRPLKATEDVHHINGIKDDNRPENLEVIAHGEHSTRTNASRAYTKGYKMKLTQEAREARSLRAIALGLSRLGHAALAKAAGEA